MADKRRFVVLGLGSFGTALAARLSKNGCRVTGVDASERPVEALKNVLYEAVVADVTDRAVLEQLNLKDAQAVFISLGENIAPSLLTALHARELGSPHVIVKGVTEEHGKILRHLGVERVVFPETEIAQELADRMTWPNMLDYLPIDPEYSFVELAVPASLSGKTLVESQIRRRYGVWVIGIKDALTGTLEMFPDGDYRLTDDQMLLVVGKQDDLARLREVK